MKYRTLGRTGIKVSPYCLGAMMFGGIANPDHEDCIRIIHKALDFGINFVDTADRYSNGESEEIVGKALKGRRQNIVLATKVNGTMGEDPNQQGNSRRWITQAVEASLRRLHTNNPTNTKDWATGVQMALVSKFSRVSNAGQRAVN
jgi:aryl-alcohol dehydrogenase-like predicted oxidoreductase